MPLKISFSCKTIFTSISCFGLHHYWGFGLIERFADNGLQFQIIFQHINLQEGFII